MFTLDAWDAFIELSIGVYIAASVLFFLALFARAQWERKHGEMLRH